MLFLQASRNHTTGLALPLPRFESIFIIPAALHLWVSVTMVRFTTVTIKVRWPRQAVAHTKIGLFTPTGTWWPAKRGGQI